MRVVGNSDLIDISPVIDGALKVWPGDTLPARQVLLDMRKGDNLTLSTLAATVHLGSHADAPSHYGANARTIEQQELELYIGPCRVVRVEAARGTRIEPAALPPLAGATRVLIATASFPDPTDFNTDFAALSPALVDRLHDAGVRLIGIDTPSVDLFDDKQLLAHNRFLAHDMAILEGLVLDGVPPGDYELIAPPLKLKGFDASPVRAVLKRMAR